MGISAYVILQKLGSSITNLSIILYMYFNLAKAEKRATQLISTFPPIALLKTEIKILSRPCS